LDKQGSQGVKKNKAPKGWRSIVGGGFDHQFFDNKKLDELERKEHDWKQYNEQPEEWKNKKGEKKGPPPEFTEEDAQLKEDLMCKGFSNWNKRDFFKFINCCEQFGRDNIEMFGELYAVGKTFEEVKEYSRVFWKNYTKIENYRKYMERIEKGEIEIAIRNSIDKAINDKFNQLEDKFIERNPEKDLKDFTLHDIEIVYDKPQEGEGGEDILEFTPEEDKIYAMGLFKYTYGYFELLKNDVRNSPLFLFNWAVYTRTTAAIQRRCDYLIQ
jgi:SWI/SNF-related matrix-associated actin-dependent regulator of chromatin subfamily A member 5